MGILKEFYWAIFLVVICPVLAVIRLASYLLGLRSVICKVEKIFMMHPVLTSLEHNIKYQRIR